MLQSFKQYLGAVCHWWWVMVIGIVWPVIEYALKVIPGVKDRVVDVPTQVWWVTGILGLSIAQFLAFHKVRVERDRLTNKAKRQSVADELAVQYKEATELLNTRIANDAQLEIWKGKVNSFQGKTEAIVTEHCSNAELLILKSLGGAKKTRWELGYNGEHNDILTGLDTYRSSLEKLITRYLEVTDDARQT